MAMLMMAAGLLGMAQGTQPANPQPLLDAALQCRTVADNGERLRCFDDALARLAEAAGGGGLVLAERRLVEPPPREIEGIIRSASEFGFQRWLVTLEDGGSWITLENSSKQLLPEPGQKVRITRTSIGGHILVVNGRRPLRVRRARN